MSYGAASTASARSHHYIIGWSQVICVTSVDVINSPVVAVIHHVVVNEVLMLLLDCQLSLVVIGCEDRKRVSIHLLSVVQSTVCLFC